jgi:hypothetical protein
MRAIKAASMYVAAEVGVRMANRQFSGIDLSLGSTQRLDKQASGRLKCWRASGKCPLLMLLGKHLYSEPES